MAAGCARRGAYSRLCDPGGRPAEDGNLRPDPLLATVLPGGLDDAVGARVRDCALADRHHLRGAGLADAEGHEEYGGVSNVMPIYATITLIMFMSSMGLPLLNGFVGEFTILQGTFMENKVWAAWAVPGVILAAAYLLWLYQRVFFGKVNNPKNEGLLDLSGRELATFIPLVLIAFWIGLYPTPF